MKTQAVLFDIDGTLIDTGGASDRAWRRAFKELQDVDVDVESFRGHALDVGKGFPVRVRTAIGQDVVLLFHTPRRPGAALVRSAKAALRPIPAGVIYPG